MNVNDIIRRLSGDLPGVAFPAVIRTTNAKVQNISKERRWRWYEAEYQFTLVPTYSTGTVECPWGGMPLTYVRGTGATYVAAMVGRKFRALGGPHYYIIDSIGGGGVGFNLTAPFAETALVNATYEIYQDLYALPADFRQLNDLKPMDSNYAYSSDEYSLWMGQILLATPPADASSMLLRYWRKPVDVITPADDLDIPPFLEEALYQIVKKSYIIGLLPREDWMNPLGDANNEYERALRRAKAEDTMQETIPSKLARTET